MIVLGCLKIEWNVNIENDQIWKMKASNFIEFHWYMPNMTSFIPNDFKFANELLKGAVKIV